MGVTRNAGLIAADSASGRAGHGFWKGLFRAGMLLPHQSSDQIGDRAVAVVSVSRSIAPVLSVLTEKRRAPFWVVDFKPVLIAALLTGIDNGIVFRQTRRQAHDGQRQARR